MNKMDDMIRMKSKPALLFALTSAASLAGCLVLGPGGDRTIVSVHSGDSFGECLGYCVTELRVGEQHTVKQASGWTIDDLLPVRTDSVATASSFWSLVVSRAASVPIESLNSVYGCPDCADGGAEWVRISYADGYTRKITFEYRNAPASLVSLADTLRGIRAAFKDEIR